MLFKLSDSIRRYVASHLTPRRVTPSSIRAAYAVAVAVDVAQVLLGPFGWAGVDEVLDACAMYGISKLIGFHPLLLPTFVLEFVPFTDMLPTWTGCVALVVMTRKREQIDAPPPGPGDVIDV